MKKIFNLTIFVFLLISSSKLAYSGWYGGTSQIFTGSSPSTNCGSTYCETTPNQTLCFNGNGDNAPIGDNKSAVYMPTHGAPIIDTVDPIVSDNTDYSSSGLVHYETSNLGNGNMNCYYWDDIEFIEDDIQINDNDLYGIDTAVNIFASDLSTRNIVIDFDIKKEVSGVESSVTLDDIDNGIDTIEFTLTFYDNTHLDQYNNSGTAVFASGSSSEVISGTSRIITYNINNLAQLNKFSDLNSKFSFPFIFFNSTVGDAIETRDDFVLERITYDVSFKGGQVFTNRKVYNPPTLPNGEVNGIPIKVGPLYSISYNGELYSSGLTEGVVQTGSLNITLEGSDMYVQGSPELRIQKTGTGSSNFVGSGTISSIVPDITLSDATAVTLGTYDKSGGISFILKTLFNLATNGIGDTVDDIVNVRLYNYIRYNVNNGNGNRTVTYLAGVINSINSQSFEKLKIYGLTNIDESKQKDLVDNQDIEDIQNLAGNIQKSSLKRDLRKRAISTVKLVEPKGGLSVNDLSGYIWADTNGGNNLGNILYFGSGSNAIVELSAESTEIEGQKTIIVKGHDLYIKENVIINNSSEENILGIIALEDDNGNGGKVYIDPDVQEIDAVIYADKSLIGYSNSYDNGDSDSKIKHEIDGYVDSTIVRNQLYIFGSVFSENTIGGSKIIPPVCPFWVTASCDIIEAQKYDLNYLRSGSNDKYNPAYANYPTIIKYNSAIQSTPPPLFGE